VSKSRCRFGHASGDEIAVECGEPVRLTVTNEELRRRPRSVPPGDSSRSVRGPASLLVAAAYAPKTIHALLTLATKSVKVWQQTGLRLS